MITPGIRHATMTAAAAAAVALLAACSSQGGPSLEPIEDQIIAVGEVFELEVRASSDSGGELRYDYGSNAPALGDRAQLTMRPDGTGLFTWTPNAADVGVWTFDFAAVDATGRATESVTIDVRSAIGAATMPVFRRPLGSGTAVKLSEGLESCVTLDISVSDQDSTEVRFTEEAPRIEGAELLQENEFEAEWHWCPTEKQRAAQDRYILTLSADDGANPKAIKRYQIILRGAERPSCAGAAPTIAHVAADAVTLHPLAIEAEVADESGLKAAPLLYYSTTPPATPGDVTGMIQLTMELAAGDTRRGTWKAEIPSPLDGAPSASLYYAIVAEDNDDSGGACDHLVTEPFEMKVSAPAEGEGGRGACEPCDADAQCGGEADHCLLVGTTGESYCFAACDDTPGSCPDGYTCSPGELTSVDGAVGRQCVPLDERCDAGGGCPDDAYEQNDGRDQAQALPADATTTDLRVCPVGALAADEDWFALEVPADAQVTVQIAGDTYPNMELAMLDATGTLIAASEDWGSDDDVTRCLSAGTYYVRVYSYFSGENDYAITVSSQAMDCPDVGGTCEDDAFEDDDGPSSARVPDFEDFQFASTGNQVCTGDEDYFFIHLFGGETIHGTLRFTQQAPTEDLDLIVVDAAGFLASGCTEEEPFDCDPANGQSTDSDETLQFTAPDEGDYYVVVRGWEGAENEYDVCLALQPGICTL